MDFSKRSNWTVRLLYLQIAIGVIAIITGTLEYGVLRDMQDGNFASEAEMLQVAEANDARQAIVGVLEILIFLGSGIWILRWIYVACSNARDLALNPMQFTPGWAVGWYFVPIALLWKPYQAMKEIWRVSANPRDPNLVPDSPLLSSWWFFFIVTSLSGNASFRMSLRADEVGELIAANLVTRISDFASIPLAILLIAIVRRIHDNQERARSTANAPEPENPAHATA
jgi:uncharacterized protein DUF4328